jgi:hypothetical protein
MFVALSRASATALARGARTHWRAAPAPARRQVTSRWLHIALPVLLALLCAPPLFAGITIDASTLTPDVNETVTLTVTITGATEPLVLGPLPELEGVTILATGSGTRLRTLDGKVRVEDYLVVEVTPHRAGRLELSGIAVAAGADTWEAPVVRLTVGRPQAAPAPTEALAPRSPKMRILAEATPRQSYIGEPVLVAYTLLAQGPILRCVPALPLDFPGFSAQLLNLIAGHTMQQLDGENYHSWPLSRHLLTAASPGHKLLPARPFRVAYRNGEQLGPEFTVEAPPLSLEILDPPGAHQPAAYEGLVGDYLLTAALDNPVVAPLQYATLKIQLNGRGQPFGSHPHLQLSNGLELKASRMTDHPAPPGEVRREWEFPILALQPGEYRLGPVTLSAFSPARGEYEILSTAPIRLTVRGSGAAAAAAAGWRSSLARLRGLLNPRDFLLLLLLAALLAPAGLAGYALFHSPAARALRERPAPAAPPEALARWARGAMAGYLPGPLRHAPLATQASQVCGAAGAALMQRLENARFGGGAAPSVEELTRCLSRLRWRRPARESGMVASGSVRPS